jgi:hypothetical protein
VPKPPAMMTAFKTVSSLFVTLVYIDFPSCSSDGSYFAGAVREPPLLYRLTEL